MQRHRKSNWWGPSTLDREPSFTRLGLKVSIVASAVFPVGHTKLMVKSQLVEVLLNVDMTVVGLT